MPRLPLIEAVAVLSIDLLDEVVHRLACLTSRQGDPQRVKRLKCALLLDYGSHLLLADTFLGMSVAYLPSLYDIRAVTALIATAKSYARIVAMTLSAG